MRGRRGQPRLLGSCVAGLVLSACSVNGVVSNGSTSGTGSAQGASSTTSSGSTGAGSTGGAGTTGSSHGASSTGSSGSTGSSSTGGGGTTGSTRGASSTTSSGSTGGSSNGGASTSGGSGSTAGSSSGGASTSGGSGSTSGSSTGGASTSSGSSSTGGGPSGVNFQICTNAQTGAQYLTSPWTYDALASGSQSYTVAQYEALPGYGTTLPPLPSYIADEPSTTEAAVIFAPGATTNEPAYDFPLSPLLYFFEGGSYATLSFQTADGDLFIGGSAPGYPEPVFTGAGSDTNIDDQNDTWDFSGGGSTLASPAKVGATSLTTTTAIAGYISVLAFPDGTSFQIASNSGTSITLSSGLTNAEGAGTAVWANRQPALANLSGAAAQGAATVQTGAVSVPILPWEYLNLGAAAGALDTVQVSAVSGSMASGYTLTLTQGLSAAASAGAPVFYAGPSGDVTVQYLDIGNGGGNTAFWVSGASGWTIENDYVHDDYAGGTSYQTTDASGTAIIGADHSTIEYNCFQRLGEYALNGGGTSTQFDYNQVDQTPYQPDLSGNGQTGCGKWWGSTNNDVIANAFTNEGYSVCIWFDNGNTGMLVQNNYFYDIGDRAIQNETGYNSQYLGNDFEEVAGGIYLNDSGGWDIPGSRYNNQILIQGNTFDNALMGVNIWGASARSCLNSGEAVGNDESAPYCSGGFPQMPPLQQYFSHYFDSTVGGFATVASGETCSAASPCSTVTLSGAPTQADWIGFAGQAPNGCSASSPCGSYTSDPVQTSTSDVTDVSTFAGAGTINAPSTAGFPSSGQLMVDTSEGSLPYSTGAVVSYAGTTASSFTGVKLVSGAGTLSGTVEAVQPYQVTAVVCPGGNCTNNAVVTVSPPLTSDVAAGTTVYATGTCPYYVTVTATPGAPAASNGTSYYDGCMWEDRNITVTGNTFEVDPTTFNATPTPEGGSAWSCTTGASGNCAQNAMGYQYPGGNAAPYNDVTLSNALMSAPSFTAPLDDLNASGSPAAVGSNGDVGPNAAAPYNNVWSGNTYVGGWTFQAYTQAAGCPLDWTGSALQWTGGSGDACAGLSVAQWTSIWQQN